MNYKTIINHMMDFSTLYEEIKNEYGLITFKKILIASDENIPEYFVEIINTPDKKLIHYSGEIFIFAKKALHHLTDEEVEKHLHKIFYDDFCDYMERKKLGIEPIFEIKTDLDFVSLKQDKIPLINLFKDKSKIEIYNKIKNDDYLRYKHSCSTQKCFNTEIRNSHYIPRSILKHLLLDKDKVILKFYPFDLIDDELSNDKKILDDFIYKTSIEANRYTTARIYCEDCENKISKYELNLFKNNNDLLKTIKVFEERFIDFIKVKNKEFSILRKHLNIKKEDHKKREMIQDRMKELKNLQKIIEKEDKNRFNPTFFFEIKDCFAITSMIFITENNIKNIFDIYDNKNLKNANFKNSFLIINLLPNNNGCFLSFSFRNLSYIDSSIVTTFFQKHFSNDDMTYDLLYGVYRSIFRNFSETFIGEKYFYKLSLKQQNILLIAACLKHKIYRERIKLVPLRNNPDVVKYLDDNNIIDFDHDQKTIFLNDMLAEGLLLKHAPKIVKFKSLHEDKDIIKNKKYFEIINFINNQNDLKVDISYEDNLKHLILFSYHNNPKILYEIIREIDIKTGYHKNIKEYLNPDLISLLNFNGNKFSNREIKDILLAYVIHKERLYNLKKQSN